MSIPHLLNFGGWLSLLLPACQLIFLFRAHRKKPLLARIWVWLLALFFAALVLKEFSTLLGRDGGLAILLSLLTFKLFESRTRRDGQLVILLAYFSCGIQFLHDQEPAMLLMALLSLALVSYTNLRLQTPAGNAASQRQFTVRMLIEGLPLALFLFVVFPRLPGPLWQMPAERVAKSGLSDNELNPGNVSALALDDSVAFRAEFAAQEPRREQLYWRGPVFSQFDGHRWLPEPLIFTAATALNQSTEQKVMYTITLEPHQQRWLPALETLLGATSDSRMSEARQLVAEAPVSSRRTYTLLSTLVPPSFSLNDPTPYLDYPAARNPKAVAFGRSLLELTPDQRIQQTLSWLRKGGFSYTLAPGELVSSDPVDEFLFEKKAGFCEHYAGSFALIMRAAGIPARVITGYQGGLRNDSGNYYMIRQADAHAWTEVWLADRGWQRIDPTAAVAPARISSGLAESLPTGTELPAMLNNTPSWIKSLRLQGDALLFAWDRWIVRYDQSKQNDLLQWLQLDQLAGWQLGLLLCTILGGILGVLFWMTMRQRMGRKLPAEQALYLQGCRLLARRYGIARAPHEGPQAYRDRLLATYPSLTDCVQPFFQQYIALHYGQPPAPAAGLAVMQEALRRLRKGRETVAKSGSA
ncbi:DUF3488 domain-containing transglutaminase family protein [Chitinilyticum litopenaei]|uniref:DUF3488 domain-containing transglutaminase family protein n=1 Tax=Chitinilyticum piscinae TaxID=2866724 RepID=A0A8J7KAS5_9NEIS|nr:DUF3488 domain-containing transglutaminase family protein [Chitinilyticum piscinae]